VRQVGLLSTNIKLTSLGAFEQYTDTELAAMKNNLLADLHEKCITIKITSINLYARFTVK
jgi:hypothetical protein